MEFGLLGAFTVNDHGRELALGGPQQRAVLAVLALRPQAVVATTALVSALWADAPPATATTVVHTYVSRLRRALPADGGAEVLRRSHGYVLTADPGTVDARRFERQVEEARSHTAAGHTDEAARAYREALGLWRGDVLADLPWLQATEPEVTRLNQLRLVALEERIDADLARGQHGALTAELGTLVDRHPYRERLWGQLMVALYRSGRQADALAAYRQVRTLLVEELGIEPGPELQALEQGILHHTADLGRGDTGDGRPPLPSALAHPGHDGRTGRLVGRAAAHATLDEAHAVAEAGHLSVVFIGGEPGIGKTALVTDFARRAHADGATVVLGRADEPASAPYGPLAEAVGHWARHRRGAAAPGDELAADDRARLGRIVPRLRAAGTAGPADIPDTPPTGRQDTPGGTPGASAPQAGGTPGAGTPQAGGTPGAGTPQAGGTPGAGTPQAGDDTDRLHLFAAVGRWLEVLAAPPGPAPVVVLEDLQWADAGTLLALRHLLRHPPAAGVLVLGTHRDIDLPPGHPLLDLLADAHTAPPARRHTLAGLDGDAVEELLRETINDAGPAGLTARADELAHRTGGNPLLVHETLRYLTEQGAIAATGEWQSPLPLADAGVPTGVRELVEQRLRQLPAEVAALLRQASVLGERFEPALLVAVAGLPKLDVADALETAAAAGFVGPDGSGPTPGPGTVAPAPAAASIPSPGGGNGNSHEARWAFAHALVREAILAGLGTAERARTHWRAGRSLLDRPDDGVHLADAAHHLTAGVDAGDPLAAVEANVRAGEHALGTLAFEDALAGFGTAVDLLASAPAPAADPDLAYRAWIGRGHAAGVLALQQPQRQGFEAAARIAREAGWPERLADATIGFVSCLTASRDVASDTPADDEERVDAMLDEALARLGDEPTPVRGVLVSLKVTSAVLREDGAAARAVADEGLAIARRMTEPEARPYSRVTYIWSRLGRPADADLVDEAEHLLTDFDTTPRDRLSLRVFVLPVLPAVALQLGDRARYDHLRRLVADDPHTWRSTHLQAVAHMWDNAVALAEGRFAAATDQAEAQPGADGWGTWASVTLLHAIVAEIERGSPHCQPLLAAFLDSCPAPPPASSRAMLASVAAAAGDHAVATEQVAALRAERDLTDLGWGGPVVLRHLGESAAWLGDRDLAAELLPVLQPYDGQLLVSFGTSSIDAAAGRVVGQLLLALDRPAEAVPVLAAAHRLETGFGARALAARTAYWWARAARTADPGDPSGDASATAALHGAAAIAEDTGMKGLALDIAALDDPPPPEA